VKATELTRTAYHEAGHAVAAFFEHLAIKSVTVVPDEGSFGKVKHYRTPSFRPDVNADARTNQRVLAHMLVDLAGPAAEREIGGRAFRHATSHQDYQNAADLATRLCGSDESVNALLRWVGVCARDLVRTRWPMIELLAKALLTRRTLNGRQVREVILAATRNTGGA
jgi:ATP-dependent Zn protease